MSAVKKWLQSYYQQVAVAVIHVLSWGLYIAFYRTAYIQQNGTVQYQVLYLLSILLTDLPVFYFFYFRAIPKLLVGSKVWRFVLVTIVVALAYPLARYAFDLLFVTYYPKGVTPLTNIAVNNFNMVFGIRALAALFVIAMAGIGKFTFDWFTNQKIRRELENQNLTSELAFLKSQVNPHFLFNTLNNIHTLAYKKSDGAPEAIMKLSDLMRYMIYESDAQFVPLDHEVRHLKSFVDLQELRFKSDAVLSFTFDGDLSQQQIAPLILLPFVENAFKHGYDLNREDAIQIRLTVGEHIVYEVQNPTPPKGHAIQKDQIGGIGLENIKRRLAIIYEGRYTLSVDESSDSFKVTLTIKPYG